jgi:hypothetical protein
MKYPVQARDDLSSEILVVIFKHAPRMPSEVV